MSMGGVAYFLLCTAPGGNTIARQFTIPLGETRVSVVARSLYDDGFIKNAGAFRIVFSMRGGAIEPGGYLLSSGDTVWEIAHILSLPPTQKWVVIPEGLRKEEIAVILAHTFLWSSTTTQEWITYDTAQNPDYTEGVYFPDTYLIPLTESPTQIAKRFIAKFEEEFAPYATEALTQNIKWTTVIKLASIVQREAAGKNDMPLVAGIL